MAYKDRQLVKPGDFISEKFQVIGERTFSDRALYRGSPMAGQRKCNAFPSGTGERFLPISPAKCGVPHAMHHQERWSPVRVVGHTVNPFDPTFDLVGKVEHR
jgi:hypothetical protein